MSKAQVVIITPRMYRYVKKYGLTIRINYGDTLVLVCRGRPKEEQLSHFAKTFKHVITFDINKIPLEQLDPNGPVPYIEFDGTTYIFVSRPIDKIPGKVIDRDKAKQLLKVLLKVLGSGRGGGDGSK